MSQSPEHSRRTIGAIAAVIVAEVLVVLATLGPLLGQRWWSGYRLYFSNDQLSYAAIATNVASGTSPWVEPFTRTGVSYYPSGWYALIGLVSRVTTLPVYLVWTLLGILAIGSAVAVIGVVAYRLSGRWYAPLVPGILLFTGTLSTIYGGYWYSILSEHAVLWGPYAALFTLNAETAGLSMASIAAALLVYAAQRARTPSTSAGRWPVVIAALLVGLIANVQTYSFFSALVLTALVIVWHGILARTHTRASLISLGLMIIVLLAGPAIAAAVGPLPLFALLIAATLPAILSRWSIHWRLILISTAVLGVAAAPQVVHTLVGMATGNEFLHYREASTKDLGVPLVAWALAWAILLLLGVAAWLGTRGDRGVAARSLLLALLCGMVIMASNDLWGFDQEPYRLWIEFNLLAALLLAIPLAVATSQLRALPRAGRVAFFVVLAVAVVTFAFALSDVRGFWQFAGQQGVLDMQSARMQAMRDATVDVNGLLAADPCIDQQHLKLATGKDVGYLNLGLAWPEHFAQVRVLRDWQTRSKQDPEALRDAGVRFVLSDDSCEQTWTFTPSDRVIRAGTQPYVQDGRQGIMTLWRVLPR